MNNVNLYNSAAQHMYLEVIDEISAICSSQPPKKEEKKSFKGE